MTCKPDCDPISALAGVIATTKRQDAPLWCWQCSTVFDLAPNGLVACPGCGGQYVRLATVSEIEAMSKGGAA